MKAGFAGEDAPKAMFPALIGRPKFATAIGAGDKTEYVGDEANNKRGVLKLSFPIENGIVKSFDDLLKLWHHTFYNELRVQPEECNVMVTESPDNPKLNREKMVEMLFETFQVKCSYVQIQGILAMYSNGRTTGVTIDSGDGVTHSLCIYEGYKIQNAGGRSFIAGRELTNYSVQLIKKNSEAQGMMEFNTAATQIIRSNFKETLSYVAASKAEFEELAKSENDPSTFEQMVMPDNSIIQISKRTCASVGEAQFEPSLVDKEDDGMHLLTNTSIQACDIDLRTVMYKNIVMSGGNTCLRGMPERLNNELEILTAKRSPVAIQAPPERKHSVWIGGSILCSLSTFQNSWITKEEFEESGVSIIHRKCVA